MKTIFLSFIAIILFSCSKDDCASIINEINNYYDAQIQLVINNPVLGEIDYRKIGILNKDRERKLQTACN